MKGIFERIGKLIPGFGGYATKEKARESDYQIRLYVKRKLEEYIFNIERSKSNMPDNELLEVDRAQNDLRLFCSKISNQKYGYRSFFKDTDKKKGAEEDILVLIIENDEELISIVDHIDYTDFEAVIIADLTYKLNTTLTTRQDIIG
ncbi:MAG: hypothetical protein ACI8Y9_001760 [Paracoccaceae bacterium]|jgi:hypothetical protein|tara:strand:+ start:1680 stop:2120 length:441 start_codon:yes stop_codon:yes gene_type:complete